MLKRALPNPGILTVPVDEAWWSSLTCNAMFIPFLFYPNIPTKSTDYFGIDWAIRDD